MFSVSEVSPEAGSESRSEDRHLVRQDSTYLRNMYTLPWLAGLSSDFLREIKCRSRVRKVYFNGDIGSHLHCRFPLVTWTHRKGTREIICLLSYREYGPFHPAASLDRDCSVILEYKRKGRKRGRVREEGKGRMKKKGEEERGKARDLTLPPPATMEEEERTCLSIWQIARWWLHPLRGLGYFKWWISTQFSVINTEDFPGTCAVNGTHQHN